MIFFHLPGVALGTGKPHGTRLGALFGHSGKRARYVVWANRRYELKLYSHGLRGNLGLFQ